MGSGKGDIDHYVSSVVPGTMLFELDGVEKMEAKRIFKKITSKLPINTKFVDREDD